MIMNTKEKNILEKFAIVVPILTAFLIFTGFLYVNTYYTAFGIKIVRYMNISEILFAFLEKVQILFYFIIAISVYCFIIWLLEKDNPKKTDNQKRDKTVRALIILCLILSIVLIFTCTAYGTKSSIRHYYACLFLFFGVIIL